MEKKVVEARGGQSSLAHPSNTRPITLTNTTPSDLAENRKAKASTTTAADKQSEKLAPSLGASAPDRATPGLAARQPSDNLATNTVQTKR
jgi:hypothetical protein